MKRRTMIDVRERIEKLIGDGPGSLGLDGWTVHENQRCWAEWRRSLIDRLAINSVLVGGERMDSTKEWIWSKTYGPHLIGATHSAIILDIQPLKRGIPKSHVVAVLRGEGYDELADDLEREGVRDD